MDEMELKNQIIRKLFFSNKEKLGINELLRELKLHKKDFKLAQHMVITLLKDKTITKNNKNRYYLTAYNKYFIGKTVSVKDKFGFVHRESDNIDLFVPGHSLQGSIPGDMVLAKEIESQHGKSATAVVISVEKRSSETLTGYIMKNRGNYFVISDNFGNNPLIIENSDIKLEDGDKVAFTIYKRGSRHSNHIVKVMESFGSSYKASSCAEAYFAQKDIPSQFSEAALIEAKAIERDFRISEDEINKRTDLRDELIFTIDGADTKDIDDAVSIKKYADRFELGVHIADVSHYVKMSGSIENDAFERGTSIYYADKVIPMLPVELSNNVCSLNPNKDRLAFSCIMQIDLNGELLNYEFKKSVIKSKIQGVYSEINEILNKTAATEITEKYKDILESLNIMQNLSEILKKNRIERGAPQIESVESKIITDVNGACIDIKPHETGISQGIIEEFMLMANKSAASLAMKNDLPFVYRVHEKPSPDKLKQLHDILTLLGIEANEITEKTKAKQLSNILNKTKKHSAYAVVNRLTLRAMAKAKYLHEPIGHYGLVMDEYAHFTSPIRRYSDLAIHRILTEYLKGTKFEVIKRRFNEYAVSSSTQASMAEVRAVVGERDCEKFYMAEYMKSHINENYTGMISGVVSRGIFVQLENTVEGFISIDLLPKGEYECQENFRLTNKNTNQVYTIGDKIDITCVRANVSLGEIDFILKSV